MLLTKLAEPYQAKNLLEMSRAFKRERHPQGAEWHVSTNGSDFFHTPYPFPSHLFRGQNQYFEPCLPSVSRGLENYSSTIGQMSISDQSKIVIRIAKSHWFAHEIERHPAVIWAKENQYTVNRIGLAQHYELETGYIDVSHDFDVAAFFATCQLHQNGRWTPVCKGVGVIYIFDLAKAQRYNFSAEPVSLQPLPRPRKQKAWLVEIPFGADFDSHPAVTWIKFQHDEHISKYFLRLFDEGKSLFPDEPIARVANKIRQAPRINEKIVDSIISQWNGIDGGIRDAEGLKESIAESIDLGIYQGSFIEEEDLESIKLKWETEIEEFGNNCTTIPVALVIHPPANGTE